MLLPPAILAEGQPCGPVPVSDFLARRLAILLSILHEVFGKKDFFFLL